MRLRPRSITLLAALVAGVLTDVVVMAPTLHFAYRSVPLHAMLETTATLIGLFTTVLLWGRFQHRRGLDDLLLFLAVGLLSLTTLLFAAIPAAVWTDPHPFSTWTTVAASAFGALLLAGAAYAPKVRLRDYEQVARLGVIFIGIGMIALGTLVGAFVESLPVGIDPARSPVSVPGPIAGNVVIAVSQLVIGILFAAAAFGFTRRAELSGDVLLRWLGPGCMVAAFARLNYFVFPSLYSEWVYTGDALRLGWHVLLFVGAAREIQLYQRGHAESLVLEERRRIARDLHDGLAQELAFMATTTRDLAGRRTATARIDQLASAAERALDESRRAISSLTRQQLAESFDSALIETVEEIGQRLGAHVVVDAEPAAGIPPDRQEQLLRIVREAVTNAARHGSANVVRVQFSNGRGLYLKVEDDGVGFDPGTAKESGFGLVTMRERAARLGGQLFVRSSLGGGTEIEVIVP
jgi:signal transduction histidine kinase